MNYKKKRFIIAAVAVLVIAGGLWYWQQHRHEDWAKTTSKAPSAQNDYKGDDRHTDDVPATNANQGGAVDNNGDNNGSANGGVSSGSGLVTILGPTSNQVLTSGSVLRGRTVDISRVQYRVMDDNVGVIAQGTLNVVNGTFSGTMQFSSKGATGRVDVFTYNQNYNEENSVQIPVKFKN